MKNEIEIRNLENSTITVTVKVTNGFRLRLWIAKRLMHLTAWVLGAGINFQVEP